MTLEEMQTNLNNAEKNYLNAQKLWNEAKIEKEKYLNTTMYLFEERGVDITIHVKFLDLLPKELRDAIRVRDYSDGWTDHIKIYCTLEERAVFNDLFEKVNKHNK